MTSHIFCSAAGTALCRIHGPKQEASKQDVLSADSQWPTAGPGWLVLDLYEIEIAAKNGPWRGAATPGAVAGCRVVAGADPRSLEIHGDPAGVFLISVIDLLLRSHGVRLLIFVGSPNADLRRMVEAFALFHGYAVEWHGSHGGSVEADSSSCEDHQELVLPDLAARVSSKRAALVLIDVQNDFCADNGATGRGGQPMTMIKSAVERIRALLEAARGAGLFIVHVRAEYGEAFRSPGSPYRYPVSGGREPAVWTASAADLSEVGRFVNSHVEVCLPGSWGGEFVEGIIPLPGEAVITKHRFSAFADTGLDRLLRARGLSSLVVAGVTTNCCVETTAREAVMRDFHLVVAEDCVAVKDHLADLHRATLESLGLYFGLVRPSEVIMAQWRAVDVVRSSDRLVSASIG
jgi:nicotinamidase-related amidase